MSRAWMSAISHSQKRNGLVCGLSTRKIRTPCSTQNNTTFRSSSHSAAPGVGLEMERVDVLIALRWVLCVLQRAIGTLPEPLRVIRGIRMVGRHLIGEI